MAQQTQEKLERLTTQLPAAEKAAIEKKADENGRSAASEVRMAIRAWLGLTK